jgi:hypothetical protein
MPKSKFVDFKAVKVAMTTPDYLKPLVLSEVADCPIPRRAANREMVSRDIQCRFMLENPAKETPFIVKLIGSPQRHVRSGICCPKALSYMK